MADALGGGRGLAMAEANRRLDTMVRVGRVVALDPAMARIKVQAGGNVTTWLPWTAGRAGPDRDWAAPEPGEQVLVLAPAGDLGQAVVVPGIYQARHPAPGDSPDVRRTVFKDGTVQEYDRAAHAHLLDLRACDGSARILTGAAETLVDHDRIELRVGSSRIVITDGHILIDADRVDLNP